MFLKNTRPIALFPDPSLGGEHKRGSGGGGGQGSQAQKQSGTGHHSNAQGSAPGLDRIVAATI